MLRAMALPLAATCIAEVMARNGLVAATAVSTAEGEEAGIDQHSALSLAAAVAMLAIITVGFVGGICCSRPVPMQAQLARPVDVAKRKKFSYVKVR